MVKKNRRLLKIVNMAVEQSFGKNELNSKKASGFIASFKKLPSYQAIFALAEYLKGIKRIISAHTAVVEAATPLSKSEIEKVLKPLNSKFKIQNSKFYLNPSLLGGIKVKIGDTVLDYSVSRKIKQVKGAIANG